LETFSSFKAPSGDGPWLHSVSRRIASLVAPGGGRPEVDFAEFMLQSMRLAKHRMAVATRLARP